MTGLHPAAAGLDYTAEIALHCAALADAAEHNLAAPIEHCPGWTVADLVLHVLEVHWFWATIVEHRLSDPPPDEAGPAHPSKEELVDRFRAGALHLVEVLRHADPAEPVWTWAPSQRNIAFVQRHQVQEAAVHRWDAEHAAGHSITLGVPVCVDSIEEFLTFSVASVADPADPPRPSLDGTFVLRATDADAAWTVTDDDQPGTVRFERGAQPDHPVLVGTASDLLLWLYRRVELPVPSGADELLGRFVALTYTD
jgi:uncharacterized protein (TIGR03083 family)